MRIKVLIYILIMCASAVAAKKSNVSHLTEHRSVEEVYQLGLANLHGSRGQARNVSQGVELIEYAAQKNYAPAINVLGLCHVYGYTGQVDYEQAWNLFVKAMERGCVNAQYNIAQMYNNGWYVPENITRYMVNLREAASKSDPQAQAELGMLLLYGDRRTLVEKDEVSGIRLLNEALAGGSHLAMLNLGYAYRDGMGGLKKNPAKAFEMFSNSYERGNLQAQVEIGKCMLEGFGTAKDYDEAYSMLTSADIEGNGEASYVLGTMYALGLGHEANDSIAASYYHRAADRNFGKAMPELAWIYLSGRGVQPDPRMAYKYFEKGASVGESNGYTGMGLCHEYAVGTYFDIERAMVYYRLGSDSGDDYADYCLYNIYRDGKYDQPADRERALECLRRACESGSDYGSFAMGKEYLLGDIYEKDVQKGIQLITQSADSGNADASAWLGNEYYSGKGYVKRDFDKAFSYLLNVARHPGVMEDEILAKVYRNLSACYRFGRGTVANEYRADYFANKANNLGDPEMGEVVHFRQRQY